MNTFHALLYSTLVMVIGIGLLTGFVIFMGERQERRNRKITQGDKHPCKHSTV